MKSSIETLSVLTWQEINKILLNSLFCRSDVLTWQEINRDLSNSSFIATVSF